MDNLFCSMQINSFYFLGKTKDIDILHNVYLQTKDLGSKTYHWSNNCFVVENVLYEKNIIDWTTIDKQLARIRQGAKGLILKQAFDSLVLRHSMIL